MDLIFSATDFLSTIIFLNLLPLGKADSNAVSETVLSVRYIERNAGFVFKTLKPFSLI